MTTRCRPVLAVPFAVLAFAAPAQAGEFYVQQGGVGAACTVAQPCAAIPTAVTAATDGSTIHIGPGTYTTPIDTSKRLTFTGAGAGSATSTNPATDTFVQVPGHGLSAALTLRGGGRVVDMRLRGQDNPGFPAAAPGLLVRPGAGLDGLSHTVEGVVAIGGSAAQDGPGVSVVDADAPARVFTVAITASTLISNAHALELRAASANVTLTDSALNGDLWAWTIGTVRAERVDGAGAVTALGGNVIVDRSHFDASPFTALSVRSQNGNAARATVRDSVFVSANTTALQAATPAAVVSVEGGTNAGEDSALTSVGSTFYATGAHWNAALMGTRSQSYLGNAGVLLTNTIVRRAGADGVNTTDILARTANSGAGGTATIAASHSAFSSSRVMGLGVVPAPGSATNVSGDPLFASAPVDTLTGADLTLQAASPLIDLGDAAASDAGELDFDGAARSLDGNGDCTAAPDIGAFERPALACPTPITSPDAAPPIAARPAVDKVKPVLSQLRIAERAARFRLSEKATVTLVLERAEPGRRTGRRCVASRTRGKRCTTWVRVRRLTRAGKAGANTIKLGKLKRNGYRVRVAAFDAAGNVAAPASKRFSRR